MIKKTVQQSDFIKSFLELDNKISNMYELIYEENNKDYVDHYMELEAKEKDAEDFAKETYLNTGKYMLEQDRAIMEMGELLKNKFKSYRMWEQLDNDRNKRLDKAEEVNTLITKLASDKKINTEEMNSLFFPW